MKRQDRRIPRRCRPPCSPRCQRSSLLEPQLSMEGPPGFPKPEFYFCVYLRYLRTKRRKSNLLFQKYSVTIPPEFPISLWAAVTPLDKSTVDPRIFHDEHQTRPGNAAATGNSRSAQPIARPKPASRCGARSRPVRCPQPFPYAKRRLGPRGKTVSVRNRR